MPKNPMILLLLSNLHLLYQIPFSIAHLFDIILFVTRYGYSEKETLNFIKTLLVLVK